MGIKKKMKNLTIMIACLFTFSSISFSQTFVQTAHDFKYVGNGETVPTGTIYVAKDLGKKFGFSSFTLVSKGWAEVLIGPFFRPIPELTLGVQIGIETPSPHWRFATSTIYFKNNNLAMLFLQKGSGSNNYWYSLQYQNSNKKFIWGGRGQRFYGWGPDCGVKIGSSILTIAPLYDFEAKRLQPTMFWKWVL
jgi:hypothetical protein